MNKTKVCNVCQIEKDIKEFAKHKNKPSYRCKKCLSEYNKTYYQKNQEKLKQQTQKFRDENPEYMKLWEIKNNKHRKEYRKKYKKEHKNAINKHERERRKKDHAYRVKKNLRRRVNEVITKSNKKCDSTLKLLGCSLETFLQYMRGQFTEGMSWDNYGKWHIDHIIPCASFDLTDPEQQRKCFHYTNLQPLWAEDNMKKGSKVPDIV